MTDADRIPAMFHQALQSVPALRDSDNGIVNIFVETPSGSRDKFDLNHETGLFEWSLQLPLGNVFPFAFGFVPHTLAEDGDALDIVLLVDGAMPQGVIVPSRLVGVLSVKQDEEGDGDADTRNDRIIAIPTNAQTLGDVNDIANLREGMYDEIAWFFENYNRMIGREFTYGEPAGRDEAMERLEQAIERAKAKS